MPDSNANLFTGSWRTVLERELLVPYLVQQRWFGGKARKIVSARFADWASLGREPTPVLLAIAEVTYADGAAERYHLPLAIVGADRAASVLADRPESVLARVPGGTSDLLCDAVMDDDACRTLAGTIWRGIEFPTGEGIIVARAIAAAPRDSAEPTLEIGRLPNVHSNTAITLGGRYLLKLFRRVEAGLNPEVEIGRFLARSGKQVHIPALIGSIEYVSSDGTPATLALVQTLIPSRENGWDYALEELSRYLALARTLPAPPTPALARDLTDRFLESIAALGRRTAEMHRALASSSTDPDFVPEQTSAAEVDQQVERTCGQATAVLDLLGQRYESLDRESREVARQVLERRAMLLDRLEFLGRRTAPFMKIRVHGDYHLGQVLRVNDDFVIIDFEGEPTRSLAERRAKQSPLRDVAGMLRSLSYAAQTALIEAAACDHPARAMLASWAVAWQACTSSAFLQAYLEAARGAVFMPADLSEIHQPLEMFTLEKALYELHYEMNNRPEWVSTPLTGILQVLESGALS